MMDFNINHIIDICLQSIIFKNMKRDVIYRFLSSSPYRVIFIEKGELIVREDEYIDYVGLILNGEVNVCKYSLGGNETLYSKLTIHEVFNLEVSCTPSKKSFYNIYATKPTFFLKIDNKQLFEESIFTNEERLIIYRNIISCIANTNAKQCHKIEIVSQKSIRDKIMIYLLVQKSNNNSNKFKISFDRDQLANYLCINRSVLSHELSLMQQEGIIKFKKSEFEILE